MLWYLNKGGKLAVARVRTGLTDGQMTEIQPRDTTAVTGGMQVIVGVTNGAQSTTSAASATSNPLQPSGPPRRGPGGF